tara:strand:+ start:1250 stop:2146 length:897 start_codon:yes stop_codon:yes gene_type:complete
MVDVNDGYNVTTEDVANYDIQGEKGDSGSPVQESSQQNTVSENSNGNGEYSNEQNEPGPDDYETFEDYEIDIDGDVYSMDDIMTWKEALDNKSEWSKSNTQKAQQLSNLGKLYSQMQGDPSLVEHLKTYYADNPNGLRDSGIENLNWEQNLEIEPIPDDLNPDDYLIEDDPHNQLFERVEAIEHDKEVKILESQLEKLEHNFPDILGGERTDAFLQFVDESNIGDLETGFRLWATDDLLAQRSQDRALDENRQRNQGRVIGTHEQGASQVVSDTRQYRGPKAYNNMNLDDPEISKYFD